jgi:hypothetical protein
VIGRRYIQAIDQFGATPRIDDAEQLEDRIIEFAAIGLTKLLGQYDWAGRNGGSLSGEWHSISCSSTNRPSERFDSVRKASLRRLFI